jgi:hypothetical protein
MVLSFGLAICRYVKRSLDCWMGRKKFAWYSYFLELIAVLEDETPLFLLTCLGVTLLNDPVLYLSLSTNLSL